MKWERIDDWHCKSLCANFTITEVVKPELYKFPFQLYYKDKLLGSFATQKEAMREADNQIAGQI
jgi:hypothetical protein